MTRWAGRLAMLIAALTLGGFPASARQTAGTGRITGVV